MSIEKAAKTILNDLDRLIAQGEVEILKQENAELRKALEFYADRKNWRYSGNDQFDNTIHYSDASYVVTGKQRDKIGGKLAREALAKLLPPFSRH